MNKTLTANISGIVFHIESDAFDKLNIYLNTIRTYFKNSEGTNEIMGDIEARIAELFKERLKNEREVINMQDVDAVIEIMGEPEQYMDPDEETVYETGYKKERFYSRKLFRDPDDKMLGGVCSGIAYYFGIDRIWLRAAFLIAVLAFGVGIIPYIILWIVMPVAKTAGEKLEMKGEPVTVDNIGRTIRDEFNSFKKKVNTERYSDGIGKVENFFAQFFSFLAKLLVFAFKFIIKFIAFIIILACLILLFCFIASFFAAPGIISFNHNGVDFVFQRELIDLIIDSALLHQMSLIALFFFIFIPLISLLYAALKLMFNFKLDNRIPGIVFASLWLLSLFVLMYSAFSISKEFTHRESKTMIEVVQIQGDTLYLSTLMKEGFHDEREERSIFLENDSVYSSSVKVNIYRASGNEFEILFKKKAYAETRKEAHNKLENIEAKYQLRDSLLMISEYFAFPKEDMYRHQQLQIKVGVPTGKYIYLNKDSRYIIYDIENTSNTWDYDMLEHHWQMQGKGLSCTDCEWSKTISEEKALDNDTIRD